MLAKTFAATHVRSLSKPSLIGAVVLSTAPLVESIEPSVEDPVTARISVGAAGSQATGESSGPSLSADGRHVAFVSWASDLVSGDANAGSDVFVKDRATGLLVRASVAMNGSQPEGESFAPSISGDGRLVGFASDATNLVADDSNGARDVFVRDLLAGTTSRISITGLGEPANAGSYAPSMASEGRHVAFTSHASNLVASDTNGKADVFVRDLQAGTIERISVGPGGAEATGACEGASISSDGRYVAFASTAGNLVPSSPEGDTNRTWDVFVRDRTMSITVRASVATNGAQGNGHSWMPSISGDGRYVAFESRASTLIVGDTNGKADVFVRDMQSGSTWRVSDGSGGIQANGPSLRPVVAGSVALVAFASEATNLVAGDSNGCSDVFVHDLGSGITSRVSVGSLGAGGNGAGLWPAISHDGRFVAFPGASTDLVPGDTNGALDVFVRGPLL